MRTAYKVLIGVGAAWGIFSAIGFAETGHAHRVHVAAAPHSSTTSAPSSTPTTNTPSPSAAPVPSSSPSSIAAAVSSTPTYHTVSIPGPGGTSFGLVTLPGTWDPTPVTHVAQDSTTSDVWTHNGNTFTFMYEEPYGMNHDVANGSDAFDPAAGLPPGVGILNQAGHDLWTFGGGGLTGIVYTSPNTQGEYLATVSGPNSAELSQILQSVQFYQSDLNN